MQIFKNVVKSTLLATTAVAISATFSTTAQAFTFTISEPTKIQFDFIQSAGAFQSDLNLFSNKKVFLTTLFTEVQAFDTPKAGDFIGTCGETVLVCSVTRTLDAGIYKLGLQTGTEISYKAKSKGDLDTGLRLSFEDGVDKDYNDFVITAKAVTPEPSLLMGAGLVASGLVVSRRRQAA